MPSSYDVPKYYEIAFSFRDIPAEVSVFEECFRRHSRVPVKDVLELGSGNSPHMEELARRGYRYTGLEINPAMLAHSRGKAARAGIEARLVQGDMLDFELPAPVDFAFILLGSLFTKSNEELGRHFDCMARALRPGGLYLLDWCVQFETPWAPGEEQWWVMERDGIRVQTTVSWKARSLAEQTCEEKIVLEVDDHGTAIHLSGTEIKKALYPQEFRLFLGNRRDFEFVGWWNNWDLEEPLADAVEVNRPIVLVRRA